MPLSASFESAFTRVARVIFVLTVAFLAVAREAATQNLFEVQVFPDETVGAGQTEVEFHNVLIPAEMAATAPGSDSGHVHLSVELTHGWSDRFETGVFLESAPNAGDPHPSLAGWHIRPKLRFPPASWFPFHVSASAEYAFFKNPSDSAFRQALTLTPILERHSGTWEISLNTAVEVPIAGPSAGSAPIFEPSAKVASRVSGHVALGLEYYAETGTIRHFEPVAGQRHLLFPALDWHGGTGWDVNVGFGRGLTGGSEHWVLKSILGVRLPEAR
jgi:hypothetical protein